MVLVVVCRFCVCVYQYVCVCGGGGGGGVDFWIKKTSIGKSEEVYPMWTMKTFF